MRTSTRVTLVGLIAIYLLGVIKNIRGNIPHIFMPESFIYRSRRQLNPIERVRYVLLSLVSFGLPVIRDIYVRRMIKESMSALRNR